MSSTIASAFAVTQQTLAYNSWTKAHHSGWMNTSAARVRQIARHATLDNASSAKLAITQMNIAISVFHFVATELWQARRIVMMTTVSQTMDATLVYSPVSRAVCNAFKETASFVKKVMNYYRSNGNAYHSTYLLQNPKTAYNLLTFFATNADRVICQIYTAIPAVAVVGILKRPKMKNVMILPTIRV